MCVCVRVHVQWGGGGGGGLMWSNTFRGVGVNRTTLVVIVELVCGQSRTFH